MTAHDRSGSSQSSEAVQIDPTIESMRGVDPIEHFVHLLDRGNAHIGDGSMRILQKPCGLLALRGQQVLVIGALSRFGEVDEAFDAVCQQGPHRVRQHGLAGKCRVGAGHETTGRHPVARELSIECGGHDPRSIGAP